MTPSKLAKLSAPTAAGLLLLATPADAADAAKSTVEVVLPALLAVISAAAALPASWLAWRLALVMAGLGSAAVRTLAVMVRAYTHRSPTKADDEAGERVAAILEKEADKIDRDAERARRKGEKE